jgi:hypothetical protein
MVDVIDIPDLASKQPAAENSVGLDGIAVKSLLGGALLRGHDPVALLRAAGIDPKVYGNEQAAIDGRELFRLVRQAQVALDDSFFGFFAERFRLALELERTLTYLHCETFGESIRVSIRFTQALSEDIGPQLIEVPEGLKHECVYHTIEGVDRGIFVWLRFVWIFQWFSWLIRRPLRLRGVCVRASRPVQANGFDRFALFGCPIQYEAPVDALIYDRADLGAPLVHRTLAEFEEYNASNPDWFATPIGRSTWRAQTEQALVELQRARIWSADTLVPPEQTVAFYERHARQAGGMSRLRNSARLFLTPGMMHCGGGAGPDSFNSAFAGVPQPTASPGSDLFLALTTWRENGDAPDQVIATTYDGGPANRITFQRPLCAYPRQATYAGHGSTRSPENFQCLARRDAATPVAVARWGRSDEDAALSAWQVGADGTR